MVIFEEEKEGLAGESARARVFLKLTGIYLVLGLILWNIGSWIVLKVFAGFCFLGVVYGAARSIFHLTTLGIVELPENVRPFAQVLVAVIAALPPFFYFLGEEKISLELLPGLTNWVLWLSTLFIVYVSYKAAHVFGPPLLHVRSYLVAVAIICVLTLVQGNGGLASGDDEDGGGSSDSVYIDPKTPEGKRHMASNYLRLISASYVGLALSMLKRPL